MAQKLVNCTPHAVRVHGEDGSVLVELPPSGGVARVTTTRTPAGGFAGVPLATTEFGEVEGLPEPQPDTMLIVSGLVRSALPGRADLASPGPLVRDETGRPTGCIGLTVNGGER